METIVELLLNNKDFNKEYNSFNYAFYSSKGKITDLFLISKYLDINDKMFTDINILKQNKKDLSKPNININNGEMNDYNSIFDMLTNVNETMLSYSVKCKNNKMVDLINNHPDFDKKKSNLKKIIVLKSLKN